MSHIRPITCRCSHTFDAEPIISELNTVLYERGRDREDMILVCPSCDKPVHLGAAQRRHRSQVVQSTGDTV